MVSYCSTRGGVHNLSFQEAVLNGLASDGGLIIPESFPTITAETLKNWSTLKYRDLAYEIMRLFISKDEITNNELKKILHKSYTISPHHFRHEEVIPVVQLKSKSQRESSANNEEQMQIYVMEMFHGPTFAFKDIALQFLGNLFEYFIEKRAKAKKGCDDIKDKIIILGATSGDTGSSAIAGLRHKKGVEVVILYPHEKVSKIQEKQMITVLDDNIHNLAVKGTFDDCQSIVKKIFSMKEEKQEFQLGAVNSINFARILAQIVYYFYAYFKIMKKNNGIEDTQISFSVPTGNFGDVLAGYYAKRLGLPVGKLIVATNQNDILHQFFKTGVYSRQKVIHTISPSMDICVSSNFERYLYVLANNDATVLHRWMEDFEGTGILKVPEEALKRAQEDMIAYCVEENEIVDGIRDHHIQYSYTFDPHSAIGAIAASRYIEDKSKEEKENTDDKMHAVVVVATAHYGKFMPVISRALSQAKGLSFPEQHPILERLDNLPVKRQVFENDTQTVYDYVKCLAQNGKNCRFTNFVHNTVESITPSKAIVGAVIFLTAGIALLKLGRK